MVAAGERPAEATRLAWYSGLIEGATTVAFSAIPGAGGLEDIASGSAREAFRRTLGESVRSAWKEGAKAFGKGVLAEIGEEELIAALDTAFVQTRIEPGMTDAQFMKRLYDTAITTAFASGGFSAAHGVHAYTDTVKGNKWSVERTAPVDPTEDTHEPTLDAMAGSIRTVNPNYPQKHYNQNCVLCVIATEQRFAGDKKAEAAATDGPLLSSEITRKFGGRFEKMDGKEHIEDVLKDAGDGSRGIVLGTHPARKVGHVWNVRIDKGVVRFLDSQLGEKAGNGDFNFAHFTDFRLLITNRGKSKP